ncbi:hypothetical protein PUR28_18885 [Streptomyces sp. BE308]|uniref:hypothetical protein n=1 Tax=Streptomyces sp. BE308 TaxID=3002529 RepID=UPI002E7772E9|nr:hypothetical protein [Streptomyces sp. BE308]MEE1792799.1 hypothetical protein [Streptomyces sp. BE308]
MDSGLAALLGAAVGSAATLGAAIVNGRAQARSQRAQWSRQHRRDAYAGYLSALHDRDIAMDAVLDALRSDQPDLPDVDEKAGRFITLARGVHRACEVVILEGPREGAVGPYHQAWEHSRCMIAALMPDAIGHVPWRRASGER